MYLNVVCIGVEVQEASIRVFNFEAYVYEVWVLSLSGKAQELAPYGSDQKHPFPRDDFGKLLEFTFKLPQIV